jgi:uncharacterized protein (DUF1778 family)
MKTLEKSRFDTRLPKAQKAYFEYAASLGGFRTLTDFVLHATEVQASSIVEKHNTILATSKDQEIFFAAIMKSSKPNANLKKAKLDFDKMNSSK